MKRNAPDAPPPELPTHAPKMAMDLLQARQAFTVREPVADARCLIAEE